MNNKSNKTNGEKRILFFLSHMRLQKQHSMGKESITLSMELAVTSSNVLRIIIH